MIKAVLFDLDGVLVDTEKDGHRVAFNKAFAEFNLAVEWDENQYHNLLSIAGGKERIAYYFKEIVAQLPVETHKFDELVRAIHKRKTDILIEMISSGELPLRPGVERFLSEVFAAKRKIALCTTSNKNFADSVLESLLPGIPFDLVLAGDIVKQKKPNPEIYNMALKELHITPQEALVVEDSQNGVQAAVAAGIRVLVTTNAYTESEDLSLATVIVDNLGDDETLVTFKKVPKVSDFGSMVHFNEIERMLSLNFDIGAHIC